jgi:hypothetical protein
VPVKAKAEEIHIEVVFCGQILHNEARVDEACAELLWRNFVVGEFGPPLNKCNRIAFGVV